MGSLVSRSNAGLPALLCIVASLMVAVVLWATWALLPAEHRGFLAYVPRLQLQSLHLVDTPSRQFAMLRLDRILSASLTVDRAVPLWLGTALVLSQLATGLVQRHLQKGVSGWRISAGCAVWLFVNVTVWYMLRLLGQPLLGLIIGFALGQFAGWWTVVGYRITPADRASDARKVRMQLSFARPFSPERYFDLRRGVFMGLGTDGRPVHIPLSDARKHLQLLGETRNGKTVAATVLLAQCALLRETVLVLDPKADKHAPSVLKAAAERAGVPFVYIDLRPDQPPQFSPLSGASPSEVEELLISCFDLASKGTDADVYRVEDRAAARKLARTGATSFAEMVAIGINDESITDARKFWEDLQELAAHPVIQTREGWRLDEWIGRPAVVYIAGSTRHDNTVRLQKLVLLRLLQLIDRYGAADDANWSALFIDEFKYLLSPGALRALGTIGDRNCHLVVAHQSLGDLRDAAGLDPGAVHGAVVVNTGLKLFYKTNDPETALWGARLSGQIPSFAESISKSPAPGTPGVYQERTRPLIDENMLLALPPLTGMLYGSGVAKLMCVHYLPKAAEPPAVTPAPVEKRKILTEGPI
jgi:hypothetical protein